MKATKTETVSAKKEIIAFRPDDWITSQLERFSTLLNLDQSELIRRCIHEGLHSVVADEKKNRKQADEELNKIGKGNFSYNHALLTTAPA